MSILSTGTLTRIKSRVNTLLTDSSIGSITVSYRLAGTTVSTWSPTTQTIPAMYATSSVSAFKGSYTLSEVQASDGLIEYGDVKFIFGVDDVSGVLSTKDLIVQSATEWQGGTTFSLVNISQDPMQICYFVQSRAI